MGNTQSASSALQDPAVTPREPETNGEPVVAIPNVTNAITSSPSMQTPVEKDEGSILHQRVGRRRSLMKFSSFPSLRKKRSVIGLHDNGREGSIHSSPSRRRWRAFNGFKNRPVSTIPGSDVPSAIEDSFPEAPSPSIVELASTEKGKEREAELTEQEAAQSEDVETVERESLQNSPGPSHPNVEYRSEDEHAFSPDTMLRELRELQDTLPLGGGQQPTTAQTPEDGDLEDQVERPPTPIPASVIDSTPAPAPEGESDDSVARPNSSLVEALGSWMSGRPRRENAESSSNDITIASGLHSESVEASQPPDAVTGDSNDSASPGVLPRYATLPRGAAASIPSLGVPPTRPTGGSRFGHNPTSSGPQQDRRTLPPAATGTLVVVQGVVHTTDVRHDHAHSPSRSQTPSAFTRPPRSSSSTPTLRAPSGHSTSRSPSRASTPQPQPSPRRGRFSSLTSSLRPRSRPGTASSRRNVGTSGWGHTSPGSSNTDNASETTLDPSETFGLGVDSSPSDSDNTSASISSTVPSTRLPDTSVDESSRFESRTEVVNAIDELPLSDQLPTRTEGEGMQSIHGEPGVSSSGVDDDGTEDEGEAELSASSIEVLGTLLSVATAATAASLVTGTTDPLFSSGLAGPNPSPVHRPTVSPAQGISTADPSSSSSRDAESSMPPDSGTDGSNAEAAVNTRMRAAWENLRDRFSRTRGRRGAAAGGTEGREDPREQMLREMARAFNTGLGLDSDDDRERWIPGQSGRNEGAREAATVPDSSPSGTETSLSGGDGRAAPEPGRLGPGPEGSFERFLHNLQVDLRTALTEDYAARRARAQAHDLHVAADTSSSNAPAQTSPEGSEASLSVSPDPTGSYERPEDPTTSSSIDTDSGPSRPPFSSTVPNTPRPATLDLPSLSGNTEPSDGSNNAPPQAHGITGQPGAGINWWRLYRFPPMQLVPHPSTLAAGGVPAAQTRPLSESVAPSQDGGADSHFPTPTQTPTFPAPSQSVVPVIVVGLQSVPVNRDGAHQNHHHHHHHHDDPSSSLETQSLNDGSNLSSNPPLRERAWPLRAASRAFGRRGRRSDADPSADDGTNPSDERADPASQTEGRQGGRTYLIFVIGGYYPPNHSIVTGADDMNSFEALWELAELLGQVKPPVASKEDIEKSGLEIIKASSLSDYERTGKVASNTVERCLICLDDYEHEDDLRLLSCRHVFHKQCVDKWLEQGRNNCPACRTRGVRTGDESSAPSPTSDNRV